MKAHIEVGALAGESQSNPILKGCIEICIPHTADTFLYNSAHICMHGYYSWNSENIRNLIFEDCYGNSRISLNAGRGWLIICKYNAVFFY